jgi:hypothetical protein
VTWMVHRGGPWLGRRTSFGSDALPSLFTGFVPLFLALRSGGKQPAAPRSGHYISGAAWEAEYKFCKERGSGSFSWPCRQPKHKLHPAHGVFVGTDSELEAPKAEIPSSTAPARFESRSAWTRGDLGTNACGEVVNALKGGFAT